MLKFLQKIGKSLMLPVATLPAAGILQGLALINYETDIPFGPVVGGFLNHYVTPFLNEGRGLSSVTLRSFSPLVLPLVWQATQ